MAEEESEERLVSVMDLAEGLRTWSLDGSTVPTQMAIPGPSNRDAFEGMERKREDDSQVYDEWGSGVSPGGQTTINRKEMDILQRSDIIMESHYYFICDGVRKKGSESKGAKDSDL
jgi:hypothetical protein